MTGGEPLERLSALLEAGATVQTRDLTGGRAIALGWATVELDRAAAELGTALGVPSGRFAKAAGTLVLGARCRVAPGVLRDGISLVLMEPDTEGRLAATLARFDEGPATVWLAIESLAEGVAAVRATGAHTSKGLSGPFGVECLVLDGPIHGPHRLLVERPGTIRP